MPWIGIQCEVEEWELRRWADHVRRSGCERVAELLDRCGRMVSGAASSDGAIERMREVEYAAAQTVERLRQDAANRAAAVLAKLLGDGVDISSVMSAAGMDGWRAGSAAGDKNGGHARRKRTYTHGRAAIGPDGQPMTIAEKGRAALSAVATAARDRRYGESFEGWCAGELLKMGFKMRHVARGVGLDVTECWRHVSGYTKHWRREGREGRPIPPPRDGWAARLTEAVAIAQGAGLRGASVVLNGTRDCGLGVGDTAADGDNGDDNGKDGAE